MLPLAKRVRVGRVTQCEMGFFFLAKCEMDFTLIIFGKLYNCHRILKQKSKVKTPELPS